MTNPLRQIRMPDPDTLLDRLRGGVIGEGHNIDAVFRAIATTVGSLPMTPQGLANLAARCLVDYLDSVPLPTPTHVLLETSLRDVWLARMVDDPRFLADTRAELDKLMVPRPQ